MIWRALSLWQPWAWLVAHGHKTIENRPRRLGYRGPLLIHAAAKLSHANYMACQLYCRSIDFDIALLPKYEDFVASTFAKATAGQAGAPDARGMGGFVGRVEMVDCVTEVCPGSDHQRWFTGPFGYVFINAAPLPFRPYRGMQGLMRVNVPEDWDGYRLSAVSSRPDQEAERRKPMAESVAAEAA